LATVGGHLFDVHFVDDVIYLLPTADDKANSGTVGYVGNYWSMVRKFMLIIYVR
jgi:hypothetical protein